MYLADALAQRVEEAQRQHLSMIGKVAQDFCWVRRLAGEAGKGEDHGVTCGHELRQLLQLGRERTAIVMGQVIDAAAMRQEQVENLRTDMVDWR
ncbi:hypothetical protein GCM10011609_88240 [Lentzea pudingi]|uniref:Uncharacterized protein n=1 Tax=Lentzea pudingi TaxID=1789439 RepID=A0ABQ2IVA4_9PSEU|nr:hypothetical protein GCM10011609_88240 [Lentzea pudingi]